MSGHVELIEPGSPRGSSQAALRAGVTLHVPKPENPGFMARLFRGRRAPLHAQRDPCYIVAVLMLLDRSLALDGLVTGINTGSVMFRQASTFIFDRTGAEISIRFGDHDRRGRIASVSAEGYLIDLAEPLAQGQIAELLDSHGQMGE